MKHRILFFILVISLCFSLKAQNFADSLQEHYCFQSPFPSQILSICYLDSFITKNTALYDSLKKEITKVPFKNNPDPSLNWLIDACATIKFTDKETFFNRIRYRPIWQPQIEVPEVYSYTIQQDTLRFFLNNYSDFFIQYNQEEMDLCHNSSSYKKAWLTYYTHNHKELTTIDKHKGCSTEFLKSYHGVVVKADSLYSWVFITDGNLTGGPQKLRWRSIEKILPYKNDFVFILQNRGIAGDEKAIYIVNYRKGICRQLNDRLLFPNQELPIQNFTIERNNLLLTRFSPGEHVGDTQAFSISKLLKDF